MRLPRSSWGITAALVLGCHVNDYPLLLAVVITAVIVAAAMVLCAGFDYIVGED